MFEGLILLFDGSSFGVYSDAFFDLVCVLDWVMFDFFFKLFNWFGDLEPWIES